MQISAHIIAERIYTYYPEMMERKDISDLLKEIAEEKAKDLLDVSEFYSTVVDNTVLRYKKNVRYTVDEKSFGEEAESRGFLHQIKNVKKKEELRHPELSMYRLPTSHYIRIHESMTKEDRAAKKELDDAKRADDKKRLMGKNLNEIILLFKKNKDTLKELEEQYEKDREELLGAMIAERDNRVKELELCHAGSPDELKVALEKEEKAKVYATEDHKVSFSLIESQPDYDLNALFQSEIDKDFLFSFGLDEFGSVVCTDWYLQETFTFIGETEHDGHTLHFNGSRLSVDGHTLLPVHPNDIKVLKKKNVKEITASGHSLVAATIPISGSEFLKRCPTSASKVERLIEKHPNLFTKKEFEMFRQISSEDHLSVSFEMIDEQVDSDRRSFFYKKMMNHAQRVRRDFDDRKQNNA